MSPLQAAPKSKCWWWWESFTVALQQRPQGGCIRGPLQTGSTLSLSTMSSSTYTHAWSIRCEDAVRVSKKAWSQPPPPGTTHFIYLLTAGGRQPALSHVLPWLHLPCRLFPPTPYYLVSNRVRGLHSSLLPSNSLDATCKLANLYLGQVMYWGNGLQCSEDQFPHLSNRARKSSL